MRRSIWVQTVLMIRATPYLGWSRYRLFGWVQHLSPGLHAARRTGQQHDQINKVQFKQLQRNIKNITSKTYIHIQHLYIDVVQHLKTHFLIIREDEKYSPLTFVDALHLATRGGASLLNMQETLGALQPGMLADFLLVDMEGWCV